MATLKKKKSINKRGLTILKPDDDLPRGYLSNSSMGSYLRCPKQFEFIYVKNIIMPPEIALQEGSSHHFALESTNKSYIEKGTFFGTKKLVELFKDTFVDKAKDIPRQKWSIAGERKDDVLKRGELMLTQYALGYGNMLRPIKCEERVELMIGGVPFLGYIDLVLKNRVIDYKVVKNAKTQNEADSDPQLTLYSKATKKKKVEFVCLTKSKTGATVVIESERDDKDYKNLNALASSVADAIKKGAFPMCDPSNWCCNPKWCGFYRKCKGL